MAAWPPSCSPPARSSPAACAASRRWRSDWGDGFDGGAGQDRRRASRGSTRGDGVLILTDMFGDTPSQRGAQLAEPGPGRGGHRRQPADGRAPGLPAPARPMRLDVLARWLAIKGRPAPSPAPPRRPPRCRAAPTPPAASAGGDRARGGDRQPARAARAGGGEAGAHRRRASRAASRWSRTARRSTPRASSAAAAGGGAGHAAGGALRRARTRRRRCARSTELDRRPVRRGGLRGVSDMRDPARAGRRRGHRHRPAVCIETRDQSTSTASRSPEGEVEARGRAAARGGAAHRGGDPRAPAAGSAGPRRGAGRRSSTPTC